MSKCNKAFPVDPRYRLSAAIAAALLHKTWEARGGLTPEALQAIPFTIYGYHYSSSAQGLPFWPTVYCAPDFSPDTRVFHWHWSPYKNY
jgi:hypothetical protein